MGNASPVPGGTPADAPTPGMPAARVQIMLGMIQRVPGSTAGLCFCITVACIQRALNSYVHWGTTYPCVDQN